MAACIFCSIASGALPASVVLDEPDHLAFLDKSPLFVGHTLVVPRRHAETLVDLAPEEVGPLMVTAQRVARAVEASLGAQGTFVAMNNRVSQSVPHLHVHVVPRTKGDGLKGFFWPRKKYAGDEEMAETARRIASALV